MIHFSSAASAGFLPIPGAGPEGQDSSVHHDFSRVYSPKTTWQDMPEINVEEQLQQMFSAYYLPNKKLDTSKLIHAIQSLRKVGKGIDRQDKTALELFRNLFVFPYRCDETSACTHLASIEAIKNNYGSKIIASGVEEMKGGINNIILMAISNKVLIPQSYWGPFVDGSPNISPIPHGPYYVVYKVQGLSEKRADAIPNNPSFEDIEHILVPFDEVKEAMISHLIRVRETGLLTVNQFNSFISKLKTYDAFKTHLCTHVEVENSQQGRLLAEVHNKDDDLPASPVLFSFNSVRLSANNNMLQTNQTEGVQKSSAGKRHRNIHSDESQDFPPSSSFESVKSAKTAVKRQRVITPEKEHCRLPKEKSRLKHID